jgi:hypothetical protein
MAQRVQDQLDAARNSQAIEDSVKIIADRAFGDMKRLAMSRFVIPSAKRSVISCSRAVS